MKTFLHAGDLGDIIYALPTIRAFGGGTLYLNSTKVTREPMDRKRFAVLEPLLRAQPYIEDVALYGGQEVDFDLNTFRDYWEKNCAYGKRLAQWVTETFRVPSSVLDERWLYVDANVRPKHPTVVVNRSARFHNEYFPWKKVVEKYRDAIIFVGLENEHKAFCEEFGQVDYQETQNLLEVARLISGSTLFIGNQSCPNAIAEGLKSNLIQETWSIDPNCRFPRANAQHAIGERVDLPELSELTSATPSIAVVTWYDDAAKAWGEISECQKRAYCRRHGYQFYCYRESRWTERHPSWSKIQMLLEIMATSTADWLFWTDADAFLMDASQQLEQFIDPKANLIIGGDYGGPNMGNFFIRNCPWSVELLNAVWEKPNPEPPWEQEVMQDIILADGARWQRYIRLLGDAINSHPLQPSAPFIIHAYGRSHEDRVRLGKLVEAGDYKHDPKLWIW